MHRFIRVTEDGKQKFYKLEGNPKDNNIGTVPITKEDFDSIKTPKSYMPANKAQQAILGSRVPKKPQARPQGSVVTGGKTSELNLPRAAGRNLGTEEAYKAVQDAVAKRPVDEQQYLQQILSKEIGNEIPFKVKMGFDYASGNELMYQRLLEASGIDVDKLYTKAHALFPRPRGYGGDWRDSTTDLQLKMPDGTPLNVDIQNTYDFRGQGGQTSLNIGLFKNQRGPSAYTVFNEASDSDKMQTIVKEIQRRTGGHRSKFTASQSGLLVPVGINEDEYMAKYPDFYRQDILFGGLYDSTNGDTNLINQTLDSAGIRRGGFDGNIHGPYQPRLPDDMYAIDFGAARNKVLGMTKKEIKDMRMRSTPSNQTRAWSPVIQMLGQDHSNLAMSVDDMKKLGNSDRTLNSLLSDEVKEGINRMRHQQGKPGLFNASFMMGDTSDIMNSVRTNIKGEALGAVIGAVTDKDTMHDLGRGDYKSAGTRMAGDALTGGIAGGAIQAAGKAVAPLAAKAVGPTVAGMAGAAVAPAAVAYGLAQVPDAMVAYRGGQQGRTFEEQKAKERAENVSAYREAFGGTSAGYRAPRVTTPVAKPAPKPEPRKVTWQDRRNFRRGTR